MNKIITTSIVAALLLAVGAPILSSAVISYTESVTKPYLPLDLASIPQESLLEFSMAQSCSQENYGGIHPSHCIRFKTECAKGTTSFDHRLCR